MSRAKAIGRLGMLAVGLGIGAAMAATPGIAAADANPVDAAVFDPSALIADPATDIPGLNLAISVDGISLFQSGTAQAFSGSDHDIAIAYGNDSYAVGGDDVGGIDSVGGNDDFAVADGAYSEAVAQFGNDNAATAFGADSEANASAGNGDTAYADGTSTDADAGGSVIDAKVLRVNYAGDDDHAAAIGNNDSAFAVVGAGNASSYVTSTGDIATVIGSGSEASSGNGNADFAGAFGDALTSSADGGNNLFVVEPPI